MISNEQRLQIFRSILNEVEDIQTNAFVQSAIPEIQQRIHFANRILLMSPKGNNEFLGFQSFQRSGGATEELKVYLMHTEDLPSAYNTAGNWQGNYNDAIHWIALNLSYNETPRSMACWFIHELGHALRARREGRLLKSVETTQEYRLAEEVAMHTFDYKLYLAMGNARYKNYVEEMAEKTFQWRMRQQEQPPPVLGADFDAILASCFGPSDKPEVRTHREIHFKFMLDLVAADRYLSPEEAYRRKSDAVALQLAATTN